MATTDGYTKVSWVTTIANTAAPTTTELNAGVALESYVTPDGLDIGWEDDSYDTSVLANSYSTEDVGRTKAAPKLTMLSDLKADTAWTTFAANPSGYLVARRGVAVGTAYASSQKLEVIPCKARIRKPAATAANESTKVTVEFVLTGSPVNPATIA